MGQILQIALRAYPMNLMEPIAYDLQNRPLWYSRLALQVHLNEVETFFNKKEEMSITRNSNHTKENDNDVVVTFPASKNFKKIDELKNPTPRLVEEVEKARSFKDQIGLELPSDLENLSQACHSLEVRLNVLEEVKERLKFYLDDLENEIFKSHYE